MKKALLFLKITRPAFWMYLAGPFILGLAFTYRSGVSFNSLHLLFLFYFLFPANFLLYSINDYFDQDTDRINPKKMEKEIIYPSKYHLPIMIINLIILFYSFFLLISLDSISAQFILILFVFLVFSYSARPFSFKRRPFLDSLSNALYVLPALIPLLESGKVEISPIFITGAIAWTASMHLFSAIPDIHYDKEADIHTTATILGKKNSLLLCSFLWSIFAIIVTSYSPILFITFVYPFITTLLLVKKDISIEKVYWFFPYLNFLMGFLLFLYIIFKV